MPSSSSTKPARPAPVPGQPALFEATTRTLVLTDLHYGHEVELMRGGVWVPSKAQERTRRVLALLEETGAQRLVLNGDLKHLIPFSHRRERSEMHNFFMTLKRHQIALEVVPGNHDGNLSQLLPPGTVLHPVEGCVLSAGEWSRKGLGKPHPGDHDGLRTADEDYLKEKSEAAGPKASKIELAEGQGEGTVEDSPLASHLKAVTSAATSSAWPSANGLGLCHGHAWPSPEVMAQPKVVIGHNHPAVLLPAGLPDENHSLPCWVRAKFNSKARERYPEAFGELWLQPAFVEKAGRPVNHRRDSGMGPLLSNGFVDWEMAQVSTLEGVELGTIGELTETLAEARKGGGL